MVPSIPIIWSGLKTAGHALLMLCSTPRLDVQDRINKRKLIPPLCVFFTSCRSPARTGTVTFGSCSGLMGVDHTCPAYRFRASGLEYKDRLLPLWRKESKDLRLDLII